MAWDLLFLTLVAHCTVTLSQFTLTQPSSMSGNPGQKVTISCKHSSGNIGSYYVHWYQQYPGNAPRNVIYNDNKRPSGVPDRFSGSIDSSSNAAFLSISGLQPEDEGDYYCQSYDSSDNHTVLHTQGELKQNLLSLCFFKPQSSSINSVAVLNLTIIVFRFMIISGTLSQFTVTAQLYAWESRGGVDHLLTMQQWQHWKHIFLLVPAVLSSSNAASLIISGLQPEDEGDYFCQSSDSSVSDPGGSEAKLSENLPVFFPNLSLFL
ncbi:immunoglobulin lambda-1 light chain-like [Erinaceus europaeus]|uniref:immunoglobulin lambda-1 light chain-like n=1 Tax=Erinaceus europaeus TaxID=9365 RepID=UPI0028FCD85C|nr:immunoglobulin lambda-1 light chain-like [Erinaceus europaeus]